MGHFLVLGNCYVFYLDCPTATSLRDYLLKRWRHNPPPLKDRLESSRFPGAERAQLVEAALNVASTPPKDRRQAFRVIRAEKPKSARNLLPTELVVSANSNDLVCYIAADIAVAGNALRQRLARH